MDTYLTPPPARISIVVTTYGTDTYYTQACLESVRRWKMPHHELIVVAHDESPLLRAYLEACRAEGMIDALVLAVEGHGHTRGFNLALQYARSNVIFNICNDILIGPALVDDCAHKLRNIPQIGLIGWHWYNEGTFWREGSIAEYRLRDESHPWLSPQDEANIRHAAWFTGRAFAALGGPKWLCLCNTGFFGVRREVLQRVDGGFGREYRHYWADDFLNYAVLDQGLDVRHFEHKFRQTAYFREFQYDNVDVSDRRRHADRVQHSAAFLDAIDLLGGGMSREESVFLHLLAKAVPDGAVVTNVGLWRGSSAITLLDAMRAKRATFHFIDCFDIPGISAMSAQSPVDRAEFLKYVEPFIGPRHTVYVTRANTLDLEHFPKSDFVFLDAGHTAECIEHDAKLVRKCLTERGVAAFHDYGYKDWPAVKSAVDRHFSGVHAFQTVAVYRAARESRREFTWPTGFRPPEDKRSDLANGQAEDRLVARSGHSPC